ncbi:MAG TPA: DUF1294 domain-containing protein [Clostridia bacterium]|nr:DUF1294 domain-containing protein [Clostridia bacterium]
MKVLVIYLIVVNMAAFGIMGIDKHKARRHKSRISENSIFTSGIIGGGLGVLLGMSFFHHKTKHLKFKVGIPVIVLLNIIMFGYLVQKLK